MELDVTPGDPTSNTMDNADIPSESKYGAVNEHYSVIRIPDDNEKSSKHSSRKQSKRRKKSSNHSRPLPRIIVKPLPPLPPPESREWTATPCVESNTVHRPCTMKEVLASIPGFTMKPRKRSGKKLSTAAQLQQTREGCIDLETPDSILVNTNIRALLNKHTFSLLPPLYQYKLGQLLPSVDRPGPSGRLSSSSLNNEFFARACLEWQDGLSGGEFTPENQQKMKTEAEKEKSKIDPWKLKHFEPFWGDKFRREKATVSNLGTERPSLKTTIKLRPTASITSSSTVPKIKKSKSSNSSKKMRSSGAITRSSAKVEMEEEELPEAIGIATRSSQPIPDLLPLKQAKGHSQDYVDCQEISSDTSSIQRLDDSVSTTPVDPLLLPETEHELIDLKENVISVVNIDEIPSSIEADSKVDSDSNIPETSKRLSDDNDEYIMSKRLKFEEERMLSTPSIVTEEIENSPEHEITIHTDQHSNMEQAEVQNYSEHDIGDSNSSDGKVAGLIYEYDEGSVSSLSSMKLESITMVDGENEVPEIVTSEEIQENDKTEAQAIMETPEVHYTEENIHDIIGTSENFDPGDQDTSKEVKNDLYPVIEVIQEVECNTQPLEQDSIQSLKLVEDKNRTHENTLHNFYDEHFKDAESFIMETGGLAILTPQNEEVKYSPHPNLMELSSYMSENNVTTVVTMPITQNSSIPMMEVTNTSMVSYPDDQTQDPAKPKTSAMSWKNEHEWSSNDSVINLQNFANSNRDNAKYISEDSKTSMEDVNINDENMYKDDRDANFNMESSNSSESYQSMKEMSLKQETDSVNNLVSSTTATSHSINSTSITLSRSFGKKTKTGKESGRSRSSNKVPPGAVNLERSYQICQAVIQNSPNRDALQGFDHY